MERVRAGYADVVSPFGGGIKRVSLKPPDVICIVFWTKNALPLIPFLGELHDMGMSFCFLYTINNYPRYLEPRTPETGLSVEALQRIRDRFPDASLSWRYDTIILTSELDAQWHYNNFGQLCCKLENLVDECIFSFCDYYKKTLRNMNRAAPGFRDPDRAEKRQIAHELGLLAREHGLELSACADDSVTGPEVSRARCIDPMRIFKAVDSDERRAALQKLKLRPSRKGCHCCESHDIGAYDTCGHGCAYCYANADPDRALGNLQIMSPHSSTLDPVRNKSSEWT
jgi:hypothetical protein